MDLFDLESVCNYQSSMLAFGRPALFCSALLLVLLLVKSPSPTGFVYLKMLPAVEVFPPTNAPKEIKEDQ
jgi:hypothetical protein